jgi:G6PDH family F420-dependent oxidoreductase
MTQLGYTLSSEEFGPDRLVALAERAEQVGFDFAAIPDHYHPWVDKQGQSPFVWTVLGGIAHATDRIGIATGVTRPTVRLHPAMVAQAAATTAATAPEAAGDTAPAVEPGIEALHGHGDGIAEAGLGLRDKRRA